MCYKPRTMYHKLIPPPHPPTWEDSHDQYGKTSQIIRKKAAKPHKVWNSHGIDKLNICL